MTVSPTPADHVLVDLLRDPAGAGRVGAERLDPDGWTRLFERARQQRCLPCLYGALGVAGVAAPQGLGPDPSAQRTWRLRALALQAEALRLHQVLEGAGIGHRFLKGIVLAASVYPEMWQRQMRDIDILVAPSDLARAQALLLEHGGAMAQYEHLTQAPTDAMAKHLPPMWSPNRVIAVELHAHATGPDIGLTARARAALDALLWEGTPSFAIGAHVLPCPGPEAMLLHLVIHGLHDHELNNGPILLADMAHLLTTASLDVAAVHAGVTDLDLTQATSLALSLLPADLITRAGLDGLCRNGPNLPRETAVALLLQDSANRNELRLSADLAQASTAGRLSLLAGRVFASRQTMESRWRMEMGNLAAPRSLPMLWVWFVRTRLRQMLRYTTAARSGGPFVSDTQDPDDPRTHLLRLRALRDGKAA